MRGCVQNQFSSIYDFTKVKDKCLFCQHPLRISLTDFNNIYNGGLPVLNETIDKPRFKFSINHTTSNYDVQADGHMDIIHYKLFFTASAGSITPFIDQEVARRAFIDLKPHIELSCNYSKCKNNYSLTSSIFEIERIAGSAAWLIAPLKIFLEDCAINKVIVQSDWIKGDTHIYSLNNEKARPIKTTFIDFTEYGSEKLLRRIPMIVNFD